jgi:Tol biopolymer transport system component
MAAIGITLLVVRPINYAKIERQSTSTHDSVAIHPDYSGVTIPPNIAPLNFLIRYEGEKFYAKIYAKNGKSIKVTAHNNKISIPLKKWKKLLQANIGEDLLIDIYSKKKGNWIKVQSIKNYIANEEIDGYLAYRSLRPNFNWWTEIGIYERNLTDFSVSTILHTKNFVGGCINCHTFHNNSTEKFFIATRSQSVGSASILTVNNKAQKIGTKFGYTSWHPSGKLVTYSINKVRQLFHSTTMEVRDVLDIESGIIYYDLESEEVKTPPELTHKDKLETYPTWAPDGKHLYFCSAPIYWENRNEIPYEYYDKIKYSLMRIPYDIETDTWGKIDTIISADSTGLSILLPKVSYDGKYLLFTMSDYGCFPVFRPSSDLYMLNLETNEYKKCEINSKYSESWHTWSLNSKWVAYSSKKSDGKLTRLYLSYCDDKGNLHKSFVLPQKNPAFYDYSIPTFNLPEFITEPVGVNSKELMRVINSKQQIDTDIPISGATLIAEPKQGVYQSGTN